jgi:hypothetical protein
MKWTPQKIVVAENDEAASELRFGSRNTGVHLLVGQPDVLFRQRLPFGDVLLLVLSEERNQRGHLLSSISGQKGVRTADTKTRRDE